MTGIHIVTPTLVAIPPPPVRQEPIVRRDETSLSTSFSEEGEQSYTSESSVTIEEPPRLTFPSDHSLLASWHVANPIFLF
jgi:hypothetical protein